MRAQGASEHDRRDRGNYSVGSTVKIEEDVLIGQNIGDEQCVRLRHRIGPSSIQQPRSSEYERSQAHGASHQEIGVIGFTCGGVDGKSSPPW